jgi:hypothetical protein
MPKPSLASMSVDALLKLREDINKALDRKASELRSQLSMLGRPAIQRGSRLKGRKLPPKYRSPQARRGPAEGQGLGGLLRPFREERGWKIF